MPILEVKEPYKGSPTSTPGGPNHHLTPPQVSHRRDRAGQGPLHARDAPLACTGPSLPSERLLTRRPEQNRSRIAQNPQNQEVILALHYGLVSDIHEGLVPGPLTDTKTWCSNPLYRIAENFLGTASHTHTLGHLQITNENLSYPALY